MGVNQGTLSNAQHKCVFESPEHKNAIKKTLVALAISQAFAVQSSNAANITVNGDDEVVAEDAICTFREATLSFNTDEEIGGCINTSKVYINNVTVSNNTAGDAGGFLC